MHGALCYFLGYLQHNVRFVCLRLAYHLVLVMHHCFVCASPVFSVLP